MEGSNKVAGKSSVKAEKANDIHWYHVQLYISHKAAKFMSNSPANHVVSLLVPER